MTDDPGRTIYLNRGFTALVSEKDYERTIANLWTVDVRGDNAYARREVVVENPLPRRPKKYKLYLHRFIVDPPAGLLVDHRNGVGLDCRRSNLRVGTHSENGSNRDGANATGFRGVTFCPGLKTRPYRAKITWPPGQKMHLDYHATAQEAADAYDAKCIELFGEFAWTNGDSR